MVIDETRTDAVKPLKRMTKTVYDQYSDTYDELAGNVMRPLIELILRDIQIPTNSVCLDVACGTGISTFMLADRIEGEGVVFGIDISKEMLNVAERNAQERGYVNIEFSLGDAEHLDYPDSMFDLVLCNQAFMFFPNKMKALEEMYRVLKPGGQVGLTFWAGPAWQEGTRVAAKIASRHSEIPGFLKAVHEFQGMLIELDEVVDIFESTGIMKHRIYGIHALQYIDPDRSIGGPLWRFWRTELSSGVEESILDEFRAEYRNLSESRGFKLTTYNCIAIGKKE